MKKFKKYGFTDEAEADSYIDALGTEEEPTRNAIVKCGFVDGLYMVDMMWRDKKDKDWKDFRYKLNGKQNYHTFAGIDYSDNTN